MNASGNAVTRIAAMGIVLILAAVLGLVAGNALNSRDAGDLNPGAGAAAMPHLSGFDGARYEAIEGSAIGAPAYADPYRQQIERAGQADLPDTVFPNVWGNIAAPDPVTSESWGNIAAPDPVTSESWGNHADDGASVRDSLTAPAVR